MAGSIYTFVQGVAGVGAIETSQGVVALGQSGLFLAAEVNAAEGRGLILKPGPAVSPASSLTPPVLAAGSSGNPSGSYHYAFTFVTAAGGTLMPWFLFSPTVSSYCTSVIL